MAIFHLTVKTHGFGNDPKLNALRSYAYRSGTKIIDPVTGSIYNFTSKQSEVVLTETITPSEFIPEWMKDGAQLWRSVQTFEEEGGRADAQIFRELEMSLPIELGIDAYTTIITGSFESSSHQNPSYVVSACILNRGIRTST